MSAIPKRADTSQLHHGGMTDASELLNSLRVYRDARRTFLDALGCPVSNRDPLAEFAERLTAAVLGGELAASRVQKGYDLTTESGERVQVRYVANPSERWVNGHPIDFRGDGCDLYALLVVEDLDPKALLVFSKEGLPAVCAKLGKHHANAGVTLDLYQANYKTLMAAPSDFESHGVRVIDVSRLSSARPS